MAAVGTGPWHSPDGPVGGITIFTKLGRYRLFNAAAARITGKSADDVLGRDDIFLFGAKEGRKVMEGDRRVLSLGKAMTCEEQLTVASGEGDVPVHEGARGRRRREGLGDIRHDQKPAWNAWQSSRLRRGGSRSWPRAGRRALAPLKTVLNGPGHFLATFRIFRAMPRAKIALPAAVGWPSPGMASMGSRCHARSSRPRNSGRFAGVRKLMSGWS